MKEKQEATVLSIKLKDGTDLLGYYVSSDQNETTGTMSTVMFRPIAIQYKNYMVDGQFRGNFFHELYFPFGGSLVEFSHKDIAISSVASEFFSMYYTKILGEHLVREESIQTRIIDFYDQQNTRDVMVDKNSSGFLIKATTEFMQ